jgi:predicted CoA-binding protein
MPYRLTPEERRAILSGSETVAVLGAHPSPGRAAHDVPAYLAAAGYRVLPVNATRAGQPLFGETIVGTLAALRTPVDIVDVFRPSEALAGHLDDLLAMSPRPRVVWLQLGIRDPAFEAALIEAGVDVVHGACTLADHRAFDLPAQRRP